MRRTDRIADALRGRKKAVTYAAAAAALLGAGTASAATLATAGAPAPARTSSAVLSSARSGPRVRRDNTGAADTRKAVTNQTATQAAKPAAGKPAAAQPAAAKPATTAAADPHTWASAEAIVASQTSPSEPKAADQLQPVSTAGAQAWMQLSAQQTANAKTIVQQALAMKMGVRSAVIAVATAMQESMLTNINYGGQGSLGLFQQRPSCGWGSAQQILSPKFAAAAFLTALKQHQESDPGWVRQPLWANAQAVQASGFPFAYAKWEAQAAQLVQRIALHLV